MLESIGIANNVVVSGDTRYDRVAAIAAAIQPIEIVEKFKGQGRILIAGSTWPDDESMISANVDLLPANWKLIVAPHEVDKAHVDSVRRLFGQDTVLFSELDKSQQFGKRVLIIDNIGMLSRLFAYGDVAYIGGGFKQGGIHNILEPVVFGLPVVFGPVYEKFVEAAALADLQYVFPVRGTGEYRTILSKLIADEQYRWSVGNSLKAFMVTHKGATAAVLDEIKSQKWLS